MSSSFMLSDDILNYVQKWGVDEHPVLTECRKKTDDMGGVAVMQISPEQGAFMQQMVRMIRAKTIVEIGSFTGYSALAMALAQDDMGIDGAQVYACDMSERFMGIAKGFWTQAGMDHIITPKLGHGYDTLTELVEGGLKHQVDLMFIDADKEAYHTYYEVGLDLLRSGGVMLIDNMLWSGKVADDTAIDDETSALRDLAKHIHGDDRVTQTLASIGDGVSIVVKR